jgi:hypothetical protein
LLAGHFAVITLLIVVSFIAICPHIVVVHVELIELLDNFAGADLSYLLRAIVLRRFTLTLSFLVFFWFFLTLLSSSCFFFSLFGGFFLRRKGGFKVVALVEFRKLLGRLAAHHSFLVLDPVTAFLEHLINDIVSLNCFNVILDLLLCTIEHNHVVFLFLLANHGGSFSVLNGTILQLLFGLRLALHTQEDHLILAHDFDLLAGENSAEATLTELGSGVLFLLLSEFDLLALSALTCSLLFVDLGDLIGDLVVTETTLTTTLVLLNQTNS